MIYYKKWSNFPRTSQISRLFCWNFPPCLLKFPASASFLMCSRADFSVVRIPRAASFLDVFNYTPARLLSTIVFWCMCTKMQWPVWFHRFSGQTSMNTNLLLQLCLYFHLFFLVRYLKSILVDWRMIQRAISHSGQNVTETFLVFFEHMHREFCLMYMMFCCHYLIQKQIFAGLLQWPNKRRCWWLIQRILVIQSLNKNACNLPATPDTSCERWLMSSMLLSAQRVTVYPIHKPI